VPRLACGSWIPRPRKLRKLSNRMICGTVSVAYTTTGPITFGTTCRNRIRTGLAPAAAAASTNSRSRIAIACPRTILAIVSQPIAPIAANSRYSLRPNTTVSRITKKINGRPLRISITRIIR
jgi:hypothetical protein